MSTRATRTMWSELLPLARNPPCQSPPAPGRGGVPAMGPMRAGITMGPPASLCPTENKKNIENQCRPSPTGASTAILDLSEREIALVLWLFRVRCTKRRYKALPEAWAAAVSFVVSERDQQNRPLYVPNGVVFDECST